MENEDGATKQGARRKKVRTPDSGGAYVGGEDRNELRVDATGVEKYRSETPTNNESREIILIENGGSRCNK